MKNRIITIVIFAVAILACLVAIAFSFFSFDADKKENYIQAQEVKAQAPEMVAEFETATLETLPSVIEKNQKETQERSENLKKVQMEKDILYTYLQDLKNLDENSFETYKANFPERSAALFAKSENKQKYVDGFNKVQTYKDLEGYVEEVNKDYSDLKQQYLVERNYIKAANGLITRADGINNTASASKKEAEFDNFQSDLKSFDKSAKLQNFFIVLTYILLIGAAALMLFFLLANMVANFKTSYKILVGVVLLVLAFFIGYLVGTPTLSPSAIKAGMTGSGYKMVNAACFTVYVCLFGAIFAIIASMIMNAVKNRN
jgi:hypothetical protein